MRIFRHSRAVSRPGSNNSYFLTVRHWCRYMITEPAQRTARPNVRTAQHYRGGTEPPAQSKADQPGAAQGANGSKPASGWRRLLGHETFHTLRQTNPAVYDELRRAMLQVVQDRKSTRLNSSHQI